MKNALLLMLFILCSCMEKENSPEGALRDFVESRMGTVISREFILERVTGRMLESFQNMSNEDFEKFADMRNIKSDKFKILSKSCQKEQCFITYSVGYITKKEDKAAHTSEVKKIAEVVNVDNKWLIADVSNIKTYHENLEPINALE